MCVNVFACEMCSQPRAGFFKLTRRERGREGKGGSTKAAGVGSTWPLLCNTPLIGAAVGIDAVFEVNCIPAHRSMKVKIYHGWDLRDPAGS